MQSEVMTINSVTLDAPETVSFSEWGECSQRPARLLVVGEYPSKGLSVTLADIDALVANFTGSVPIKVEHIDSPLDPLGGDHEIVAGRDGV